MPIHHLRRHVLSLGLCCLLLTFEASSGRCDAGLRFDPADWHGYVQQLTTSTSPDARRILREITDGPRVLAGARAAAKRAGIPLTMADLQRPMPPANENAAAIYVNLPAIEQECDGEFIKRKVPWMWFNYYSSRLAWYYAYTPQQIAIVKSGVACDQPFIDALYVASHRPYCVFPASNMVKNAFMVSANLRESERKLEWK
jgi:hypothetical protein